ncbi:hypothetical protein K503DRAFT_860027 [Rhizopogon vinicolor AM-OR11-026]|uniref:Uncharacterized protein n=1 Tax=Rhizopogon vinicolor AM-OR11-026 TaxID=1314800 RepID=A0A1B7MK87_9AGAM|nr:hypothetical protein K503DRAFT_860027 [Rhizopogon vinicolor AM-OR11-026]
MLEDDAKLLLEALPDTRGLIGREILDDEVKLLVSVTPNKRGMIGAGTRVRGEFNVMRAKSFYPRLRSPTGHDILQGGEYRTRSIRSTVRIGVWESMRGYEQWSREIVRKAAWSECGETLLVPTRRMADIKEWIWGWSPRPVARTLCINTTRDINQEFFSLPTP